MKLITTLLYFIFPICCWSQNYMEKCVITEFSINGIHGTIHRLNDVTYNIDDEDDDFDYNHIKLILPYGTDLTAVTPVVKVSEGAKAEPACGTTLNFKEGCVFYTVTDDKGNKRKYLVEAYTLTPSYSGLISFTFNDSDRIISPYEQRRTYDVIHNIYINLPEGMDMASLTPSAVTTEDVTVTPSLDTPQNFNEPVKYTLTDKDGEKTWVWIYASNFNLKIDNVSADSFTIGDTITIQGKFNKKNETLLIYPENLFGLYRHKFVDFPELEIISENESEIKAVIPDNVIEGNYGLKVKYNEMFDELDKNITILNPERPIVESIDKPELRVGIDSLTIKGKNLHDINKIFLFSKESGNSISYSTASVNEDGTELLLKKVPVLGINTFNKSETYYFRLENQRTVSLEEVPVKIILYKSDLSKYSSPYFSFPTEFPDEEE